MQPTSLRFAHFEVLTRPDGGPVVLGQGAMGITYKALDCNLLSVAVIKVLAQDCQSIPAVRQRFLQEAQMMARVRHPHVASVFFFGDSESGVFYAMEFCEGATVEDFVKDNGAMAEPDAFRLVQQVASALQVLHAHDLVHRDLKPSNIILARDLSSGVHVKLIDFGVAREGQKPDSGGLTQSGFIGTPAFASPEQLLEAANLDVRSDFYSLGAVLWYCLTGKKVFDGSAFDVMFHHVNTEPDWGKLPPLSEPGLALIKKLLAKSADDRPASPTVLLEELQVILGDGTVGGLQLHVTGKQASQDFGGFEPIEEVGNDAFGKVWRAKDRHTGGMVALRLLSQEVASKPALVLRIQRLAAYVRPLEHVRWQRVRHFEQKGKECRLALEWVEGPTLLTLLKARQTLLLQDIAPLLAQIADAMDFSASKGLAAVETAPERVLIQVQGWAGMLQSEHAKWLRHPVAMWPEWSVKICPLRLSVAAQDYVLPTDTEAAQAISRIASDFVVLCFRLLTGQGRSTGAYVPSPTLTSEGNDYFERFLSLPSLPNASCLQLLLQLCQAEGVALPAAAVLGENIDPMATARLAPPKGAVLSGVGGTASGTGRPGPGGTAGLLQVTARTVASVRLKELEQRRAELEREAEKLKMEERLEAERDWLAKEREALEEARKNISSDEQLRSERLRAEEAELKQRQQALNDQEAALARKQAEQQSIEQDVRQRYDKIQEEARLRQEELEQKHNAAEQTLREREAAFQAREQGSLARLEALRAEAAALELRVKHDEAAGAQVQQLADAQRQEHERRARDLQDLEKLQEEVRNREAELEQQRNAAELALREREAEFLAREHQSLSRLQDLKSEAASIEARVEQEKASLLQIEREQKRRRQEESAVGHLAKEKLAVEEQRLEQLRRELDDRLAEWKVVKRKRLVTYSVLAALAVVLASVAAYFMEGRVEVVDLRKLQGQDQWQAAAGQRERAKKANDWANLLSWCVSIDQILRANPQFAEVLHTHQKELANDVEEAVTGLLQRPEAWPAPSSEENRKLLDNLESVQGWPLSDQRDLLWARLRIRDANARDAVGEALTAYQKMVAAHPAFATELASPLDDTLQKLQALLGQGKLNLEEDWVNDLNTIASEQSKERSTTRAVLAMSEVQTERARRRGNMEEALNHLLDAVNLNPSWSGNLQTLAAKLVAQIAEQPSTTINLAASKLRNAGDIWRLPEAYLALAPLESTDRAIMDDYRRAEEFGSNKARAQVGYRMLLQSLESNDAALAAKGSEKLREAVAAGDPEGMVLLGDALALGIGLPEDPQEALKLAQQAEAKGNKEAYFVVAKAKLRLGEDKHDSQLIQDATHGMQKALDENLPKAAFFLYLANYNTTVKNLDGAAALQKGVTAQDPDCLYAYGLWSVAGLGNVQKNYSRGRTLIEDAAKLGNEKARKWLKEHP